LIIAHLYFFRFKSEYGRNDKGLSLQALFATLFATPNHQATSKV